MQPEKRKFKATITFNENKEDQVVRTGIFEAASNEDAVNQATSIALAIEKNEVMTSLRIDIDIVEV